jgi:hypothetical protein
LTLSIKENRIYLLDKTNQIERGRVMKKLIKKVATFALVLGTFLIGSVPVAAATTNERARIIQVAIPNENGELQIYTGKDAQKIYENLDKQVIPRLETETSQVNNPLAVASNTNQLQGMFTYKYRFVQSTSGTKWGESKRISTYAGNGTSVQQSKSLNASTSISWSINTELSGSYKDAFSASVGSSWDNTSSFSEQFDINVAPKKRVWLEFKPKLKYVTGEVQKYYTTRGPIATTVIEERKSVSSTSPTKVKMTLAGKTFYCPDGAYVWKEDGNYNSN